MRLGEKIRCWRHNNTLPGTRCAAPIHMIILGITGSIAAYKTPELVRALCKNGHTVQVILSESAKYFVAPLTLQTVSGHPVRSKLFSLTDEGAISHIALADQAALVLVAPATANILAKVVHGFCDDLLSTVICATRAPVMFCPAMNVNMWRHRITQENVRRLQDHGYHIIPPDSGDLACGWEGEGRLPAIEAIMARADALTKSLR